MIKFIKEFFDRRKIKIGDILVRDKRNPFQQTKIEVLDVKDGYVLYRYIMIDGDKCDSSCKHTDTIGSLKFYYTKQY